MHVIYKIKENFIIDKISIYGADKVGVSELLEVLEIQTGDAYVDKNIKESIARIKDYYLEKGYFWAEAWVKTEKSTKRSNRNNIHYFIEEGTDIPISKINIIGLNNINPKKIKSILEQKENNSSETGTFNITLFEQDKERLLEKIRSFGYLDVKLNEEKTTYVIKWRNKKKPKKGRVVIITYTVEQGPINYFAGYSLEHSPAHINPDRNPKDTIAQGKYKPVVKAKVLLENLSLHDVHIGKVFNNLNFLQDQALIYNGYSSRGYVFAQIKPQFINFTLTPGKIRSYEKCLEITQSGRKKSNDCVETAKKLPLKKLRKI